MLDYSLPENDRRKDNMIPRKLEEAIYETHYKLNGFIDLYDAKEEIRKVQVIDHEARIRTLEKSENIKIGGLAVLQIVIGIVLSIWLKK